MRSTWMAAAVAVIGLAGCGGGGSEDRERTYMACGNAQACMVMQSEVPAEMNCSAPEVDSCSSDGVLGRCEVSDGPFHFTMYIYASDLLALAEQECATDGGSWYAAPAVAP